MNFALPFFFFDSESRHYHDKLSTLAIRKIWDYFCTVNSRHHELIIDLFDIMIALLLLLVLLLSTKASRTIVILYNSVAVCKILTLNSQMSFINLSTLSLLCMCITMKLNGSLYMRIKCQARQVNFSKFPRSDWWIIHVTYKFISTSQHWQRVKISQFI